MDGVTILSSINNTFSIMLGIYVLLAITFLMFVLVIIFKIKHNSVDFWFALMMGIISAALSIGFLSILISDRFCVDYTVRVSDNVRFNEFYEKYEIIDEKGNDEYVVRERK